MIRNTLLALTATAGLLGGTELGTNTARADSLIHVGTYGRHGGFSVDIGGYRPRYERVVYPAPVVYSPAPAPVLAAPVLTAPVVAPLCNDFEVFYRPDPYCAWRLYGAFPSHGRAHEAVAYLRASGYRAYIAHR
jgi:hypothetical protein